MNGDDAILPIASDSRVAAVYRGTYAHHHPARTRHTQTSRQKERRSNYRATDSQLCRRLPDVAPARAIPPSPSYRLELRRKSIVFRSIRYRYNKQACLSVHELLQYGGGQGNLPPLHIPHQLTQYISRMTDFLSMFIHHEGISLP